MDRIEEVELKDANRIVLEFIEIFQKYFHESDMKFNIHSHLHLPQQVWRHGPLHKTSCFPFENMFRISQNLFHGTRSFDAQIAKNIMMKKQTKFRLDELAKKTTNPNIKHFIASLMPVVKRKNQLMRPQIKNVANLLDFERELILVYCGQIKTIMQSTRSFINYSGKPITRHFFYRFDHFVLTIVFIFKNITRKPTRRSQRTPTATQSAIVLKLEIVLHLETLKAFLNIIILYSAL